MKYFKVIRKYARLRSMDDRWVNTAKHVYNNLDKKEQALMLAEFQDYIDGVKDGSIIPTPLQMPSVEVKQL